MRKQLFDRIPKKCCEGPFWGNGRIGTVLYCRGEKLRLSMDHTGLWELRETLPDEPKATFPQILQHKEEYLKGDPRFVEDTNVFDRAIGRTKLPALALELDFSSEICSFFMETDLETAVSEGTLTLEDGRKISVGIWIDSLMNILHLELAGEKAGECRVRSLGWDLSSPRLRPLKNWNYEPSSLAEEGSGFTIIQHFGGDRTAVLCGQKETAGEKLSLSVAMDTGFAKEEENLTEKNKKLAADYQKNKETYRSRHREDWRDFWSGFGIRVPNERLQEAFEQEMYKLYCNEREDSSPVTLQGVWNGDDRMPAWFGDLHNDLNVQSCYWPACKTGNVNLVRPYVDYYCRAMPRLEERAWKLFGIKDAIHIPTMMTPEGTGAASEWCYWNTILGPELFVAVDFVWFYEYSREKDTLREKIYPFIEKVIHLYQGIAYEKDGFLHIPFTSSPEVSTDKGMLMADDATFTLSCLHFLCKKMAEYAKTLGMDGRGFLEWEEKLAAVKPDETGFPVFAGIDVFESHRHFCHMYPIYPLCQEAHNEVANRSLDTAVNQGFLEYAAFSFPYMGIFAARCGRGNMCRTMLELYCMAFRSRNSFTVNGDPYRNGVLRISDTNAGEDSDAFTLESGFFVPTVLCEMFVHRSGSDVWMMMGIPDEWKECSCKGLAIEGGHRLLIEQEDYRIRRAVLKAGCEEKLIIHCKENSRIKAIYRDGKEISGKHSAIYVYPGEEWTIEYEESALDL